MKVQADNFNGIFEVDSFEGVAMEYRTFKSALKQNDDNSTLECELTENQVNILDEEYGIKRMKRG